MLSSHFSLSAFNSKNLLHPRVHQWWTLVIQHKLSKWIWHALGKSRPGYWISEINNTLKMTQITDNFWDNPTLKGGERLTVDNRSTFGISLKTLLGYNSSNELCIEWKIHALKKSSARFCVGGADLVGWWPLLIHLAVGRCFLFFVFTFLIFNFMWLVYAWPDLSTFCVPFSHFFLFRFCVGRVWLVWSILLVGNRPSCNQNHNQATLARIIATWQSQNNWSHHQDQHRQ